MTTLEGPAGQAPYRVPRSPVDDFYVKGTPLPASQVGTGVVVSVDGDTLTVLVGDEELDGVLYQGDPPEDGESVEVETRGDLTLVPISNDTFRVGLEDDAEHIVSADDPGLAPIPIEVNVGGSMKDPAAWQLYGNDVLAWTREQAANGVRLRQNVALTLTGTNLAPNPSAEPNIGPDDTGYSWHSNPFFGAYAAAAVVTGTSEQAHNGPNAVKVEWQPSPLPDDVTLRVPGHVVGQLYSASVWVYVPAGSPDVRIDCTYYGSGPLTSVKDAWTRLSVEFTGPSVEKTVHISVTTDPTRPTTAGTVYVDELLVVATTAGAPLPDYFDGFTTETLSEHYKWVGTPGLSASEHWTGEGAADSPVTWDDLPSTTTWDTLAATPAVTWDSLMVVDNSATLWSTLPFEVEPGDELDVEFTLAELVPSATAQVVLLYSPIEGSDPLPTDPDVTVLEYPPLVLVPNTLTSSVTVPDTITTAAGDVPPHTGKLGILLTGNGNADLVVTSASLTQMSEGWPLGSLWMDPDAETGGLTTAASTTISTAGATLPVGTVNTYAKVAAVKKAVIQAPPDTGGIVLAFAGGSVTTRVAAGGFKMRLASMSGLLTGSEARFSEPNVPVTSPFYLSGVVPIGPGELDEITVEYTYTEATATPSEVWTPTIQTVFLPGGVMAGGPEMDPTIRWWDGDSWRPPMLAPADMDLTIDGTVPPVGRTATTTTISTPGTVRVDDQATLTATVTAGATGSVTFFASTTTATRGTALGSTLIEAGTATKTWTPDTAGTFYFTAVYTGDPTHLSSSSPPSPAVHATDSDTTTVTITQGYLQAYPAGGGQIPGTAALQGFYTSTDGNRRTLIRFTNAAIPDDADVSSVRLHCSDWAHWAQGNGTGTLVVGWHEQATKPPNWPSTMAHTDRSRHSVGLGDWWVDLSSWAPAVITRTDFEGLTIGPGPSTSPLYRGSSATPGVFTLEVTYTRYE